MIGQAELNRMREMETALGKLTKNGIFLAQTCWQMGFPEWSDGGYQVKDVKRWVETQKQHIDDFQPDADNPDPTGTACVGCYPGRSQFFYKWWTKFWDQLTVGERMYVIMHETLHIVLHHPQRTKKDDGKFRDKVLWNIACDITVNSICEYGYSLSYRPYGGIDPNDPKFNALGIKPLVDDTEAIYDKLLQKNGEGNTGDSGSPIYVDADGNVHVHGKSVGNINSPGSHGEWEDLDEVGSEVLDKVATEATRNPGRKPNKSYYSQGGDGGCGELLGLIEAQEICEMDWDEVLSKFIGTLYKPCVTENWNGPNRRVASWYPDTMLPHDDDGEKPDGCRILFAVDASGSMSPDLLARANAIYQSLPEDGYKKSLASWDGAYYPIPDGDFGKLQGGGGTQLQCVVSALKAMDPADRPECIIVFSDGMWYDRPIIDNPKDWVFIIDGPTNRVPKESKLIAVSDQWKKKTMRARKKKVR